ncbi:hypothetical protein JCM18899A_11210 [Nocardioides sp. AN3]
MTTTIRLSALSATALMLAFSGCALAQDDTPAGAVGIARGAGNHPTLVVLVCKGSFDHLQVLEMLGDGKSKTIGEYVADDPVGVGVHRVDLLHPDANWRVKTPVTVKPGLIVADAWGDESGSSQTTFRFNQIAQLEHGKVTGFDENTTVPESDLTVDKCGNMAR